MTRAIALVVAVTLLAGCKGSGSLPPIDPFGRTTVEPPRTGSVGTQPPVQSSYPGSPQDAAAAATAPSVPAGTTPATPASGRGYAPPDGSFQYNGSPNDEPRPMAATQPGDRISIPVDARDLSKQPSALAGGPQTDTWTSPLADNPTKSGNSAVAASSTATVDSSGRSPVELAGSTPQSSLAGRERIVRTIQPRPDDSANTAAGGSTAPESGASQHEPGRLPPDDKVINIMDLPAAGASRLRTTAPGSDGVRLVSAIEPVDSSSPALTFSPPPADQGDAISPRTRYNHDPNYGWLRGQIEYSQIDRRWKLRYIPIYGEMDDFGGSVLVADAAALSGYERGDFVEVRGQLDTTGTDDRHFTPEFKVHQIQRLAD